MKLREVFSRRRAGMTCRIFHKWEYGPKHEIPGIGYWRWRWCLRCNKTERR
jgi:hypothetical protein